jgi:hypothetical protein
VRVGVPPSGQGTIHTGALWMCAARYSAASSSRRNRSWLMPEAGSPRRNLFIPSALVVSADRLLDTGVPDHQKPPPLHVAAARRTDARLQDLADQFVRHRIRLQPPHRPGGSDNFEQVDGVRGGFDAVVGRASGAKVSLTERVRPESSSENHRRYRRGPIDAMGRAARKWQLRRCI